MNGAPCVISTWFLQYVVNKCEPVAKDLLIRQEMHETYTLDRALVFHDETAYYETDCVVCLVRNRRSVIISHLNTVFIWQYALFLRSELFRSQRYRQRANV